MIHERRHKPTEEMRAFAYRRASALRENPVWRDFLDTLHPTEEHCFFSKLTFGEYAHELCGATSFEAGHISERHGKALLDIFGRWPRFIEGRAA